MSTTRVQTGHRVGVAKFQFVDREPSARAVRAETFSLCLAELSTLFFTAFLATEQPDDHPSVFQSVKQIAASPPNGFPESAIQSTGARSLLGFDPHRWRGPAAWLSAMRQSPRRSGPPYPQITRLTYASPFEVVVTVSLSGSVAVSGFTLFLRAVRMAYREIRMFEVDRAELDAVKAKYRAAEAKAERAKGEDELMEIAALDRLEQESTPASREALILDHVEARVEQR